MLSQGSRIVRPITTLAAIGLFGPLFAPAANRLLGGASSADEGSLVTVELLADRSAAAPGETVNLALRFRIADDHYIYWRHPGDAGAATKIRWTAPAGSNFGVLRFPTPAKLAHDDRKVANVFRYEPILLTTLTIPADAAPGRPLTIRGRAQWTVGGPQAADGRSSLELLLPIVAPGQQGEPANQEVFEAAAHAMPVSADRAKHVKLRTELKPAQPQPGTQVSALFTVSIKKGFHIQAHDPGVRGLIGADFFFAPPPGIRVAEPVFPKGRTREVKYLGKVNEYHGQVTLEVPLTVSADYKGDLPLAGLFLYQACDDKTGVCFPPEYVAWTLDLPPDR